MRHETQRYDSIKATAELVVAGAGQTGKTVTVAIQKVDTGQWLQAGGASWGAGFATNTMTPVDAVNAPGLYEYDLSASLVYSDIQNNQTDGYLVKITEPTLSLLEYVKVDVEYDPSEPGVIAGRSLSDVLDALFRLQVTTDDDAITYYTGGAGSGGSKFYYGLGPGTARSSLYVDRLAVAYEGGVGNGDQTDLVRIGGILSDAGGEYFVLQNLDGTAYAGLHSAAGARLYVSKTFVTSRVGVIETDVLTADALAASAAEEIADQVWEESDSAHNSPNTMGALQNSVSSLPSEFDVADQVWREPLGDHSGVVGSTAEALAALSTSSIADAVWDEPLAGHLGVGSTGESLSNAGTGATPADIADAVWDEDMSTHHSAGSTGRALAITKGMVQGHHRMRNPVYDPNGRLLSAELVVYPSALDATNNTNEDFVFTVTCTYDGDGNLISLLSTE